MRASVTAPGQSRRFEPLPSWTQTVAPTTKPLSLDEVKDFCQVEHSSDDQMLWSLIDSATEYVQEYQWSQLITATWVLRMDRFPCGVIELHPNPVSAVSTVQYVDTSGNTQTLTVSTDYTVDTNRRPGIVLPAYSRSWPATRGYINDVVITFTAGFGEASAVKREVKLAMLLMIRNWYESGGCSEHDIPMMAKAMLGLRTYRTFY